MAFQPFNLQGAAATGYSLVPTAAAQNVPGGLPAPPATAVLVCRTGEFWVRPFTTSAAAKTSSGVNAALSSPAGAGVVTGWLHMLPGDKLPFGDSISEPITQVDIWCVVAGELLASLH